MLITAIIAFREFLEAVLLIGIFLGMDSKFNLGKKKEILLAACIGILFSLFLPFIVFLFSNNLHHVLTEKNADVLEGYFLTFSGFFIAYVVFSLHEFMKSSKKKSIMNATNKMEQKIFDLSLCITIIFFIVREGFEITLLVATTSLFSVFWANIQGLLLGFSLASVVSLLTSITYGKLPVKKIFTYTEYLIIIIGAAMVKNGVSMLLENYIHVHLEKITSLPLNFLPNETTVLGHALNNLFGLQQQMGLIQICIMGIYIAVVVKLFKLYPKQAIV